MFPEAHLRCDTSTHAVEFSILVSLETAMTTLATISAESLRQTLPRSAVQQPQRWPVADIEALFALPFMDLMLRAQQVYREHFDPNEVQLSTLLSIKTGGCSEDCGSYSQSTHADTGVKSSKLLPLDEVMDAAKAAKAQGA